MFTKQQILEISKKLALLSRKDTSFDNADLPLTGEEWVVLVQNGKNVKTRLKNISVGFNPDLPDEPDDPNEPSIPDEPDIPDPTITIDPSNLLNLDYDKKDYIVTVTTQNAVEGSLNYTTLPLWCTITPLENNIYRLTVEENQTMNTRFGNITFTCKGLNGTSKMAVLFISQKANTEIEQPESYVTVSPDSLEFSYNDATSKTLTLMYENANITSIDINEYVKLTLSGGTDSPRTYNVSLKTHNNSAVVINTNIKINYIDTITNTSKSIEVPVKIAAAPKATLTVNPASLVFEYNDTKTEAVSLTLKNTIDNNTELVSYPEWLTVTKSTSLTNTYIVKIKKENTSSLRIGNIVFSCKGLDNQTVTNLCKVTQKANSTINDDEYPMYVGYIDNETIQAYQLFGDGVSEAYKLVNEAVINTCVSNGNIIEKRVETVANIPFHKDIPALSLILIALPKASNKVAYQSDGIGGYVKFNMSTFPYVNGEIEISINGITYELYGEASTIERPTTGYSYFVLNKN